MDFSPAILWLAILIICIVIEVATVGLTSIWFAGGALAALVASLLGASLWLQIALFLLVSAGLLASLRGVVRKHFTPRLERTNVDALIGSRGYVTADIDDDGIAKALRYYGLI